MSRLLARLEMTQAKRSSFTRAKSSFESCKILSYYRKKEASLKHPRGWLKLIFVSLSNVYSEKYGAHHIDVILEFSHVLKVIFSLFISLTMTTSCCCELWVISADSLTRTRNVNFLLCHTHHPLESSLSQKVSNEMEKISLVLALMPTKITYRWANRGVAAVIFSIRHVAAVIVVVSDDWARCLITAEISNINVVITCLIIANEAVTRQDCRWTMKVPVFVMLISSRNVCCRLDCWQILRFELVFESWWDGDEETNENNHCLVIKMREKERRKIWK